MSEAGAIVSVDTGELERALKDAGDLDFAPFMASVATDMEAAVLDMFDTSGHGTFQALAPSTLKRKARLGKSSKPLIFNGTWRNSPTVESGADFASVGTNVSYAGFHVSDAARSKIPLRDVYALPEQFFIDIDERLAEYMASGGKVGL